MRASDKNCPVTIIDKINTLQSLAYERGGDRVDCIEAKRRILMEDLDFQKASFIMMEHLINRMLSEGMFFKHHPKYIG